MKATKAVLEGLVKAQVVGGHKVRLEDPGPPDRDFRRESDFQEWVIELAHAFGWTAAHFRPARMIDKDGKARWMTPVQADGKGWPDLFMVRGDRAVVSELKFGKNQLTPEQRHWLWLLGAVKVTNVYEWRPSDCSEIREVLR